MTASFGTPDPRFEYVRRAAAYVVIFDETRCVACVSEGSGLFLPGGGLEAGEDARAAIHREVAEECARGLEEVRELGAATQFHKGPGDRHYRLEASFFVGSFGAPLARDPQYELQWIETSPEVPALHHECHRWAVAQALRTAGIR